MTLLLLIHIVTKHEHHAMCPHQRKISTFIQLHLLHDISGLTDGEDFTSRSYNKADICWQQQLERPDKARWITLRPSDSRHTGKRGLKDSVGVLLKGKLGRLWFRSGLDPLLWRLFKPLYFIKQQGEAYLYFQDICNQSSQIQSEVVCLVLSLRLSLWQLNLRVVSAIKKTSELIYTVCLDLLSNIFYNPRLGLIHLWQAGSSITLNHYWWVKEQSRTPCTVWVLIPSCVHPVQTLNLKRRVQPNIQILSSFNSIDAELNVQAAPSYTMEVNGDRVCQV